jgi:hypothetical protein
VRSAASLKKLFYQEVENLDGSEKIELLQALTEKNPVAKELMDDLDERKVKE